MKGYLRKCNIVRKCLIKTGCHYNNVPIAKIKTFNIIQEFKVITSDWLELSYVTFDLLVLCCLSVFMTF